MVMSVDRGRLTLALVGLLAIAALGGSGGARYAWSDAPELPSTEEAAAVAAVGVDGFVHVVSRRDELFTYVLPVKGIDRWLVPVLGDDDYQAGAVTLDTTPVEGAGRAIYQVDDRLRRAGWQVTAPHVDRYGVSVRASRGTMATTWSVERRVAGGAFEPTLTVSVQRSAPQDLRIWILIGWGVGLAAGLLIVGLTTLMMRRYSRPSRSLSFSLYAIGTLLLLPATGLTTVAIIGFLAGSDWDGVTPPWVAYTMFGVRPLAILGVLAVLAAPVAAAAQRIGCRRRQAAIV
jgi:hypothetical protein